MNLTAQSSEAAPARVLIVDDEVNLAELLVMACHVRGWEAIGVGTGREAVARARSEHFDVIVLDVMLPDLDGFAVIEKIRGGGHRHSGRLPLRPRRSRRSADRAAPRW